MAQMEVMFYAPGYPQYRSTVPIAMDDDETDFLKYFLAKLNFFGTMEDMAANGPVVAKLFDEDGHEVILEGEYP